MLCSVADPSTSSLFGLSSSLPLSPTLDLLSILSDTSIAVNFSDSRNSWSASTPSSTLSYKVEWDPNPGVQEIQTISTRTYTGANEVQSITLSASDVNEVQTITTSSTTVAEVQRIRVAMATGGSYFLELDTSK